jgi:hypothetical protein
LERQESGLHFAVLELADIVNLQTVNTEDDSQH